MKWPVLVLVVSLMFAILYWAAPNVKHPGFRWISPGGLVAVVLWLIASAVFAFYVANFGSYNKTYGALGGVIIFLVWLWLSNIAVLLDVLDPGFNLVFARTDDAATVKVFGALDLATARLSCGRSCPTSPRWVASRSSGISGDTLSSTHQDSSRDSRTDCPYARAPEGCTTRRQ